MERLAFEALVAEALDSLPIDIRRLLDNVEVTVASAPSPAMLARLGLGPGRSLFGLYEGIPKTKRTGQYNLVLPDKITIFQKPIERACRTPAAIRTQVRATVIHELGHHFGLSDERLRELGAY